MGRLFNHKKTDDRADCKKKLTKGQRLGWTHKSDCAPTSLREFSSHGEKLCTYTTGPFSLNKLVP